MARYFKFNNSKSKKFPFFVYLEQSSSGIVDATGSKWSGIPEGCEEITEDDFREVEMSDSETSNVNPGDEIVVIEYVPSKLRYSTVKSIIDGGNMALLENGSKFPLTQLRRKEFIHKS